MKKINLLMLGALTAAASAVALTSVPMLEKVSKTPEEARRVEQRYVQNPQHLLNNPRMNVAPAEGYTVPFYFAPTQDEFNECLILNPAGDTGKWEFYNDNKEGVSGTFRYKYCPSSQVCDDWVITPAIHVTPGRYKMTYKWRTYSDSSYPESFKVCVGNAQTPEAMEENVLKVYNDVKSGSYKDDTVEFVVTEDCDYYVGLYAFSQPNQYYIYVANLNITKIDEAQPMTPTIESFAFHGTEGSINVNVPATNVGGQPLQGPVTLHLSVDGTPVEGSPFSCTAGEVKSVPMSLPNALHYVETFATVEVDGEVKTSETYSEQFRVTKIIDLPLQIPFNIIPDEDEASLCTILNLNNDTYNWSLCSTGFSGADGTDFAFRGHSSPSVNSDEWLILPVVGGMHHALRLNFNISTKFDKEGLEIVIADAPTAEAMAAGEVIFADYELKTSDIWQPKYADFMRDNDENFYIGFHYCSTRNSSFIYMRNIGVETITGNKPQKPEITSIDFDGSEGSISVTLPTLKFDNQPIPVASVDALLTIDNAVAPIVMSGAPGSTVTFPLNLPKGDHSVSVVARYEIDGEMEISEAVKSNFKIVLPSNFCYNIPVELALNSDDFENMKIYDVNGDNKTWYILNNTLTYNYDSNNAADEWAILPPVDVPDASVTYKVSIMASSSPSYEEKFEIYLGAGDSPEAMTCEIMPEQSVQIGQFTLYENEFTVPSAGRYNIGIHCTSAKDKLKLYLQNLKIEVAPAADGPNVVTNLTAIPDDTGLNTALVTFNMPTVNRLDEEIPASETLTATVISSEDRQTVTGHPGDECAVTVNTVKGNNSIKVFVEGASGMGLTTMTNVNCGIDVPSTPQFTSALNDESGLGIILTWAPVTTGVNGGAVNTPQLAYRISEWDEEDQDWYAVEHLSTTTYTYTVDPNTPQDFVRLGLEAYTWDPSLESYRNSGMKQIEVALGQPYALDMVETFENNAVNYGPVYFASNYSQAPQWALGTPEEYVPEAAIEGQSMLIGHTGYNEGDSGLFLPMVSTENATGVDFTIDVYGGEVMPEMSVFVETFGSERELVGELTNSDEAGWCTYTFSLPNDFVNRPWVKIIVYSNFAAGSSNYALIKGYSLVANNLNGMEDLLAGNVSVRGMNGAIAVNGAEGLNVVATDAAGRVMYAGEAPSNGFVISATQGVNIVNVNGRAYKVIVR